MSNSKKQYVLGLDTSNYTTSIALIDRDSNIVVDKRKLIEVSEGMKGIRQSEALFQHLDNVPSLLDGVLSEYSSNIKGVCASSKPRPVKDSYMPVFKAGLNYGNIISKSLNVPFYETSHQEGHIEAGKYGLNLDSNRHIAVFHLSGGTTEIILRNQIIGGTKDISYGQLIDRLGVNAGFSFPAGSKLDSIACKYYGLNKDLNYNEIRSERIGNVKFKPISTDGLNINLSGLDSQVKRIMNNGLLESEIHLLITTVFNLITQSLLTLTKDVKKQYNISCVLFVGGVSSSEFIRNNLLKELKDEDIEVFFARPELSSDNGVGVALIGGRHLWHLSQ